MKKKHLETLKKYQKYGEKYTLDFDKRSICAVAIDRDKPGWIEMHDNHQRIMTTMNPQVCLLGDSIIANLLRYEDISRKLYRTVNMAIGGDKVENVIWRVNETSFNEF